MSVEEKGTAVETHAKILCNKHCPEHEYSYMASLRRYRLKIKAIFCSVCMQFQMSSSHTVLPHGSVYWAPSDLPWEQPWIQHTILVCFPAESLSSHTWHCIKPLCLLKWAGSPLSWGDNAGPQSCRCAVYLGSKLDLVCSTGFLLQAQHEPFPCVVFWGCLEKSL